MFEVKVESNFKASHAVQLPDGRMEPIHEHDWGVAVFFCGCELDQRGLLVDFVRVQDRLADMLEPFSGRNLNEHALFRETPASAELLARKFFELLSKHDWSGAVLTKVIVTEAPGCSAAFCAPPDAPVPNCQNE